MTRAATASGPRKASVGRDYLTLVKQFPLRSLRSQQEHAAAGAILDELVGRNDLSDGVRDYIDALAHFVTDYEQRTLGARFRKLKPVEVLRELMSMNNMNTTDLGYILGTRGLASEVLNGKRGLSKALIGKLARRFNVNSSVFLPADEP